jgi:hypothetical protein
MGYVFTLPPDTALPISTGTQNLLPVDPILWAYLLTNLNDADWTLLSLQSQNKIEIIRVEGLITPNKLIVLRGRDGTIPLAFPAGATVKYVPTAEAVHNTYISPLHVTATGIINYYNGDFYVPPLSITGLGGAISGGIFTQHGIGCGPCKPTSPIPDEYKSRRITADSSYRATDDGSYRTYA